MFGGAGIFFEEVMVGLISDERIFLKADEMTAPRFKAEGCKPFTFKQRSGDIVAMSYLELPERLYDEPDELRAWALEARDAALRARASGPKGKRPRKSAH